MQDTLTLAQQHELYPATQEELETLTDNLKLAYLELESYPTYTTQFEDDSFYFCSDDEGYLKSQISEMECELSYYIHTCEDPTVIPF